MPKYQITAPDGKKFEVNAPDGATQDEVLAYAQGQFKAPSQQAPVKPKEPFDTNLTFSEKAATAIGNVLPEFTDGWGSKGGKIAGLVQGAADPSVGIAQLGANAISPLLPNDNGGLAGLITGQKTDLASKVNNAIQAQNAGYEKAREQEGREGFDWSRLAGNIASPVNLLGARLLPKAPTSAGGAFKQGAAIGGLYGAENPVNDIPQDGSFLGEKTKQVAIGAVSGGVISPTIYGIANQLKNQGLAKALMQSALKPTASQQKSGEADKAITTFLKERLNPTRGGIDELESRVGNINDDVASIIANSNKSVDAQSVVNRLKGTVDKFSTQVSPTSDLIAIKAIASDFKAHPIIPQFPLKNAGLIPVQQAQAMKQGTYRVLKGKFGETGSAATEAQKTLARGLKEEVGVAHPEILPMLSRESDLINALNVGERRALMDGNKNPISLGANIAMSAHNPIATAGLIANSSALAKSLAARGVNRVATLNNHPELAAKLAELLRKSAPYAGIPAAAPFLQQGQ